jgi:simple sugar transport system ATP-binding protein
VPILDEPTAALGVRESAVVIDLVRTARSHGVVLVFITHNAGHAFAIGNRYTALWQGRVAASFRRGEKGQNELVALMAGGEELKQDNSVARSRVLVGAGSGYASREPE